MRPLTIQEQVDFAAANAIRRSILSLLFESEDLTINDLALFIAGQAMLLNKLLPLCQFTMEDFPDGVPGFSKEENIRVVEITNMIYQQISATVEKSNG